MDTSSTGKQEDRRKHHYSRNRLERYRERNHLSRRYCYVVLSIIPTVYTWSDSILKETKVKKSHAT